MNLHLDLFKDNVFKEVKIGKEDLVMVGILAMRMLLMEIVLGLATTLMGEGESSLMDMKMARMIEMRMMKN